eukprot:2487535-Prymnesium_polylepis.1
MRSRSICNDRLRTSHPCGVAAAPKRGHRGVGKRRRVVGGSAGWACRAAVRAVAAPRPRRPGAHRLVLDAQLAEERTEPRERRAHAAERAPPLPRAGRGAEGPRGAPRSETVRGGLHECGAAPLGTVAERHPPCHHRLGQEHAQHRARLSPAPCCAPCQERARTRMQCARTLAPERIAVAHHHAAHHRLQHRRLVLQIAVRAPAHHRPPAETPSRDRLDGDGRHVLLLLLCGALAALSIRRLLLHPPHGVDVWRHVRVADRGRGERGRSTLRRRLRPSGEPRLAP